MADYPGINPHLNSQLQSPKGGWRGFHTYHINDLSNTLEQQLPPNYRSYAEESLQIQRITLPEGTASTSQTVADVAVYQKSTLTTPGSTLMPTAPTQTLTLIDLIEEAEQTLDAIVIYQVVEDSSMGKPVTRIELLSPANKPSGSHFAQYKRKRLETLKSGLNLVELDYLHETPPIYLHFPSYTLHETGSHPYWVIVSQPHPTFEQGIANVYGFGVHDPLPRIKLPLAADEHITFDLGEAYHSTIQRIRRFQDIIQEQALPPRFETYSPKDQAYIKQRMAES
jgi:hypothetical protein